MRSEKLYQNAVLEDGELQAQLKTVNPKFADFVIRVAGEAWGLPLINQKTKALIAIAIDVVSKTYTGSSNPFAAHVHMATKQGVTPEEIEELLLFLNAYAGVNKVAHCFQFFNQLFSEARITPMLSSAKPTIESDYSFRDQQGKLAFYVLLKKKPSISSQQYDDYWQNVHGPVCAKLPKQHQYWQFRVEHNQGEIFASLPGVETNCIEAEQIDSIAELTFKSEADRQTWFEASKILMDDEPNLFIKAIGYNTSFGNSRTYLDRIAQEPINGKSEFFKYHILIQKADGISLADFRRYLSDHFAEVVCQQDGVLKFRLHLFDEVDISRPDATGVAHSEPINQQYQAALAIAFRDTLARERFLTVFNEQNLGKDLAKYIKKLHPFPERTAYTFVYDNQITLVGQRGVKVADLIERIGATNQLNNNIGALMNGQQQLYQQQTKTSLGVYLQGVQHFGITVDDLDKALEFYVEVLGGRVAIGGDGFVGEDLHNLLFQKEELDANEQGRNPKTFGVPNIRNGSEESLDVRFLSFGNTCVELIHFRDAKLSHQAPNLFDKIPSGVGHANSPHISFYLKDDVDINQFAKTLEEECHRRGMTNVVANRIIHLNSPAERATAPLQYAKTEFEGDFDGWALFYCKGPNGEQLEFNQVTKKAKENFNRAQKEYNIDNNNQYWFNNNSAENNGNSHHVTEKLYGSFSIPINGIAEQIWQLFLDTIEKSPSPHEKITILERYHDGILRTLETPLYSMKQRVSIDEKNHIINFTLVDHPLFTGRLINQVSSIPGSPPVVTFTLDMQPISEKALQHKDAQWFIEAAQPEKVKEALLQLKQFVEHLNQKEEKTMVQSITTPGTKSEIVRRMFEAGESMNVNNFVKFYTEDAHYQFSNFPVAYGPQGIIDSSQGFLQKVAKVYHHITKMWEQGDTVICEMEVTYIRHDGKVFRLPCCDTIVFKGDKVQELRIYMDITPVFATEEVSEPAPAPAASGGLLKIIEKMYGALHAEQWDEFMSYFTPSLLYKVGAQDPLIGPEACRDFLVNIYKILKLTTHNSRGIWEVGNTVIIEMDANYVNKRDKTFTQVPCTDIYRFEGDKIFEWRVYPDASGIRL